MAEEVRGRIVKAISGFYYVYAPGFGTYACKAKGLFRKQGVKPLVGDEVEFQITDTKDMEGNVVSIAPRKSELLRPAVANVDQALLIFATRSPDPSTNLIDRFLLRMRLQSLPTLLCFNKTDLAEEGDVSRLSAIYRDAGCRVFFISAKTGDGIETLREALEGKVTTVAGPSGVGKSTIVNSLQTDTVMETGEISAKIERGRHTTRHTELLPLDEKSFILDTPGFSSLMLPEMEKEDLAALYPEFLSYESNCRFERCSHLAEPDCAVKEALSRGEIAQERYENYRLLYEELKERKHY